MVDRTFILADFDINDPLSRYFSVKGFEFELSFIPKDLDIPLIDFICHRIKNKKKVIIILSTLYGNKSSDKNWSLTKLFNEKSIWHDSSELTQSSGTKIVLYDRSDSLFWPYTYDDEETQNFTSWLNELEPYIFANGIPGRWLKEKYHKCKFVELRSFFVRPELSNVEFGTLKKHNPIKDFLCLMCEAPKRSHRDLLHKQMHSKGLIDYTIYKFSPRSDHTHDDLQNSFPEYTIPLEKDAIPPVHHYNQSNIEIVAETLGHHNHDESFLITEKIVKPIAMKHPFIVLSSFNFLMNLKDLGFKTFGDHLDESYDQETDVNKRIEIIIKNLDYLKGKSKKLYDETIDIREHNHLILQHQAGEWTTKLWSTMDEFFKNV